MLFENVIGFCRNSLYEFGENCSNANCTHPSGQCSGGCNKCLDEVHFSRDDQKRRDYCCEKLIYNYVLRFANSYMQNTIIALEKEIDISKYSDLKVFSIGCGASPDLMAMEKICGDKKISYFGYDRNVRWHKIHNFIEKQTIEHSRIKSVFKRADIFDVLCEKEVPQEQFNVIFIQYLISHLFNTGQEHLIGELYKALIEQVISQRHEGTPFLIIINDIDSCNKGRPYFHKFLDCLEETGFSGRAIAYSQYETGDLGEKRWGSSNCGTGKIEYNYSKPPEGFRGAALIIELR